MPWISCGSCSQAYLSVSGCTTHCLGCRDDAAVPIKPRSKGLSLRKRKVESTNRTNHPKEDTNKENTLLLNAELATDQKRHHVGPHDDFEDNKHEAVVEASKNLRGTNPPPEYTLHVPIVRAKDGCVDTIDNIIVDIIDVDDEEEVVVYVQDDEVADEEVQADDNEDDDDKEEENGKVIIEEAGEDEVQEVEDGEVTEKEERCKRDDINVTSVVKKATMVVCDVGSDEFDDLFGDSNGIDKEMDMKVSMDNLDSTNSIDNSFNDLADEIDPSEWPQHDQSYKLTKKSYGPSWQCSMCGEKSSFRSRNAHMNQCLVSGNYAVARFVSETRLAWRCPVCEEHIDPPSHPYATTTTSTITNTTSVSIAQPNSSIFNTRDIQGRRLKHLKQCARLLGVRPKELRGRLGLAQHQQEYLENSDNEDEGKDETDNGISEICEVVIMDEKDVTDAQQSSSSTSTSSTTVKSAFSLMMSAARKPETPKPTSAAPGKGKGKGRGGFYGRQGNRSITSLSQIPSYKVVPGTKQPPIIVDGFQYVSPQISDVSEATGMHIYNVFILYTLLSDVYFHVLGLHVDSLPQ